MKSYSEKVNAFAKEKVYEISKGCIKQSMNE